MVEIFFGISARQAIRRGTFTSVGDLVAAIRAFIDAYNDRREPFHWTKTPTRSSPRPHVPDQNAWPATPL